MDYRTTFLVNFARAILLPSFITSLVLCTLTDIFSPASISLIALFSIPLTIAVRVTWTSQQHARGARRLDALPIPVVRGKWPGNLDVLKRLLHGWRNGYINESLRELFEECQSPTINVRILWVDQIWTMDPNHMKHILVTGFQNFDKGAPQRQRMKGFLGTGIFAADGDIWRMHRAMARPYLAKSRTSDIALFARHAADAFTQLDPMADADAFSSASALDIQDFTLRYTLDVALDSFFGITDAGTLRESLPKAGAGNYQTREARAVAYNTVHIAEGEDLATDRTAIEKFVHAMEKSADITILRARQGVLWPLVEFRTDKTKEPARIMRHWIDAVIQKAKAREREEEKDVEAGMGTFLEHLVRSTDDEIVIRDQLINMVLGARDTTAALITFAIYFLAIHQDVYANLRAEVMELCPPGAGLPEGEHVRDFVYLRAVLNETLRVFPSVPINTRYSTTESAYPPAAFPSSDASTSKTIPLYYATPLYMPPRTSVSVLPLLMQRRTDLWGADAEEFRPMRWLTNEQGGDGMAAGTKRPEWFIPFSAGPRLCPGQNFAYAEATYLLILFMQRGYIFTLAPEFQPSTTRPPSSWKVPSLAQRTAGKTEGMSVFAEGKGRQAKEQCWPGAAFTLYSKGGMWMHVSKFKE